MMSDPLVVVLATAALIVLSALFVIVEFALLGVPRCPPAAGPWTVSRWAPARTAAWASGTEVTVTDVVVPTAASRASTETAGSPKVNETTGTRSASTSSSLAAHPSSSAGSVSGSSTPYRRAVSSSASR